MSPPPLLLTQQVLGDKAAEAEKLFAGEPETALIASILWAFEVRRDGVSLTALGGASVLG